MNAKELRGYADEFLQSLDDVQKDERYGTERGFAEGPVNEFVDFLVKKGVLK